MGSINSTQALGDEKGHEHCNLLLNKECHICFVYARHSLSFVSVLQSSFFPFLGSDVGGSDVEEEGADYEGTNKGSEGLNTEKTRPIRRKRRSKHFSRLTIRWKYNAEPCVWLSKL